MFSKGKRFHELTVLVGRPGSATPCGQPVVVVALSVSHVTSRESVGGGEISRQDREPGRVQGQAYSVIRSSSQEY